MLPKSVIRDWFESKYRTPTAPQAAAWPRIQAGENVLIVSPTGTGKTFAAFLAVLNQLAIWQEENRLRRTIYALYVSPLRALSYDLEKNLNAPLQEAYAGQPPIQVALRTGDTSSGERQRQFACPPHILLTTPESLCLLLSQAKWLPLLATVRWVMVDEIHALAENKRGSHLSLSLERLAALKTEPLQRIGLSATVAPVEKVAQFLVGTGRPCEVVDATASKKVDLRVYSPLGSNPYPSSGYTGERLIRELAKLIRENRTTLVFTNTRSGAEAATYWLTQALPELAGQIECHHASLDRDVRQEVEDRLKRGELRAVVCSTSLELGIDIGSIDLVVMLSTPKGVSRALQRTGRSGHNIRATSRGLLMATNMNDLVECCATALLARARHLDAVRIPTAPLDVLAQHLVSMGCIRRWSRQEALQLVRGAYPYRNLTVQDLEDVLDYLAGGGKSLRQQYTEVFGKIDLDETGFETRLGSVRRDLLQNIGVIPNEGMVRVRCGSRALAMIEEMFVRQLQVGDVFIIAGRPVRLKKLSVMECAVERAEGAIPTVPRWNANKMPLSNRVAQEIISFRSELRSRLLAGRAKAPDPAGAGGSRDEENAAWISERLQCGLGNARIILRMHVAQLELSDIPTADSLLVEEYLTGLDESGAIEGERPRRPSSRRGRPTILGRHYFFHSLVGRAANEALSRVVALRLSRLRGGNAVATADDYGFVLTVTAGQVIREGELSGLFAPEQFEPDLDESLSRSELLKYHFRNAAQTGMMVYRNYFGEQKPIRKVQWSAEVIFNVLQKYEPNHVLLREARRDAVHTYLDAAAALAFIRDLAGKPIRLQRVDRVPPLSFAMYATKIKEALLVEDPREMMERLFHFWWEKIEEQRTGPAAPGSTEQ